MKRTVKALNLERAQDLFHADLSDRVAQSEAAMILKTRFKLAREEIAGVLGLTKRTIMTRLHEYKKFAAQGAIPTEELKSIRAGFPLDETPQEEVIEDERERLERLQSGREARTLLGFELFTEKLAEAVAKHIPSKAELKRVEELHKQVAPTRVKTKGDEETAMATISDAHFGLVNSLFDVDMAHAVMKTYLRKIIRLTDLHRMQCPVKTIHLNLNGDNIQGSGANYPSQRWDTTLCAVDQIEVFVGASVNFIETLLVEFDNVVVNCQPGNHGYLSPKKTSSEPEHANYETLTHRALRWAFRDNPRVTFNISDEWFQIIEVGGRKLFMTHGHAIKGAGSFDTVQSTFRKLQDILPYFDDAIVGHFHRLARLPLPQVFGSTAPRTLYMNGTFIKGDTFSEQYGSVHSNAQWTWFVGNGRVTAEYPVALYD